MVGGRTPCRLGGGHQAKVEQLTPIGSSSGQHHHQQELWTLLSLDWRGEMWCDTFPQSDINLLSCSACSGLQQQHHISVCLPQGLCLPGFAAAASGSAMINRKVTLTEAVRVRVSVVILM